MRKKNVEAHVRYFNWPLPVFTKFNKSICVTAFTCLKNNEWKLQIKEDSVKEDHS